MQVLITGACGFLARTLAIELSGRHELHLLDRVRPDEAVEKQRHDTSSAHVAGVPMRCHCQTRCIGQALVD